MAFRSKPISSISSRSFSTVPRIIGRMNTAVPWKIVRAFSGPQGYVGYPELTEEPENILENIELTNGRSALA
jgi:hypothetical protein